MEWTAGRADDAAAAQGQQDGNGTLGQVEFAGEGFSEFAVFLRRSAHEGHLGIVLVEEAMFEFWRDGFRRTEVYHVQTAGGDDGGHTAARGSLQSGWSRAQH